MGSRFPESGQSVVLDLSQWSGPLRVYLQNLKQLEQAEDASAEKSKRAGKGQQQFAQDVQHAGDASKRAAGGIQSAGDAAARAGANAERGSGGFSRLTERLLNINNAINIAQSAMGAIQGMGGALGDMTDRAARVESISRAFQQIAQPIGGATTALAGLREQSQGAVSDLELMRLTNKALINSSAEFTAVVGPQFGTVIQAAFAGAAATGQSLEVVLDKVVTGLRRGSNMLLDDIGIWVSAEQAQAAYAAQLGVSVSALTEQQRAAAFSAEAIRQMADISAAAGGSSTSLAMQVSQNNAIVENAMNRLAASAGPAIGQFQAGFGQVGATIAQSLSYLNPAPFFEGGANIIAAIAHGILSGLTLVVQAVTVVAQTIASFLRGFSPPKEGPLSDIDVGGENVVKAWLDRFNSVSRAPVQQLAEDVTDILGKAGSLNTEDQISVLEQLQARLDERLRKKVAALGRGEASAEEVQALDQQRVALADQVKMLKERADLERIFGDEAAATQDRLDAAIGGDAGGGAGGAGGGGGGDAGGAVGGDYTKSIEEGRRLDITEATGGAGEKDKLDDLKKKLEVNREMREEFLKEGRDTTDLAREEARLMDQIGEEMIARGLDPVNEWGSSYFGGAKDILDEIASPTGGGGGGGGGAGFDMSELGGGPPGAGIPSLPAAQDDLAEMSAMGMITVPESGPISQAFQRIQDDLDAFVGAFEEARDTLAGIDLFGAVREFFETIAAIDTPQELITFIGNLASGLAQLPGNVAQGFIDLFTQITGIELPGWLTEGLKVGGALLALSLGFSALSAVLPLVTAGLTGLLTPFLTIVAPLLLIGFVLDQINQRWGSFEGAMNSVETTVNRVFGAIEVVFNEFDNAIGALLDGIWAGIVGFIDEIDKVAEGLGIDLGFDVSGHIDALETRERARELRAQAIGEIHAIMSNTRTEFSPNLQAAAGTFEIPPQVRIEMENLMRTALEMQDWDAAVHVVAMADSIGMTLPQEQVDAAAAMLSAQLESGLDFFSLEPEVQASIVSGRLSVSGNASQLVSNAVEAAIVVGDITTVRPEILAAVLEGRLSVSSNARDVAQLAVEASITGEGPLPIETVQAVVRHLEVEVVQEAINEVGAAVQDAIANVSGGAPIEVSPPIQMGMVTIQPTRSGGPGGQAGPASITGLMGGREAAGGIGGLGDVMAARFGGGGEAAGALPDLSGLTTQMDEMLALLTEKAEQARVALLETFLLPANEQFLVMTGQFALFNEGLLLMSTTLLMLNPSLALFGSTTLLLNPQLLLWATTLLLLNPLLLVQLATMTALAVQILLATTNLLAMTAAALAGNVAMLLLTSGFSFYEQTVEAAIEKTLEFIQVVNSIPRRIDVVLGITLEIPNLTSIGAGVAAAMQGADAAAIGAPHRAIGGDVQRGLAYWVGERGPELYFADENGFIVPNDQIMVAPPPSPVGNVTVAADSGPGDWLIEQNFYGPTEPAQVKRAVREAVSFYG